jgi:hypothetical protein
MPDDGNLAQRWWLSGEQTMLNFSTATAVQIEFGMNML